MGYLLRFLLVFGILYFITKTVRTFFGLKRTASGKQQQARTTKKRKEKPSKLDDVGDYIDYEEVKDK